MTAENLAKERLDPNIAFWKELKNGYDHFEVTKAEVPVVVCNTPLRVRRERRKATFPRAAPARR